MVTVIVIMVKWSSSSWSNGHRLRRCNRDQMVTVIVIVVNWSSLASLTSWSSGQVVNVIVIVAAQSHPLRLSDVLTTTTLTTSARCIAKLSVTV